MTLEYDSTIERSCHYPHPHDKTASEYPVPSSDYATELEKHESGLTFATSDLMTSYTHSWPKDFDMLKEVIKGLPTLDDRQVSENTHLLLLAFQKMLAMNRSMIESSRYLPPLRFRRLDDPIELQRSPLTRSTVIEEIAKAKYPNGIVARGRALHDLVVDSLLEIESELGPHSGVAKLKAFITMAREGKRVTEASRAIGVTPEYASRALKRTTVELLAEKLVLKLH